MKIIAYARVSSREQSNTNALQQQVERLKSAGAQEVFSDVESGYKGRRRESLEKVMDLVRSRQVETVIITRVDRLSRKSKEAFSLIEEFIQNGVVLRCMDEPLDLSSAAGKMAAGMMVIFSQHHSDQKSEAVKHGWEHLRRQGIAVNPPFGYIKVNDRLELDNREFLCLIATKEVRTRAAIARECVDAYLHAKTMRLGLRVINEKYGVQTYAHDGSGRRAGGRVARDMFRFSVPGYAAWLQNPVLRGHTAYLRKQNGKKQKPSDWVVMPDTHPGHRLMTDEEYGFIENTLEHNRQTRGYGSVKQRYPFSGLVFCGECRCTCYSCSSLKHRNTTERNYYYQCKNWRSRGCTQSRVINMDYIESDVIAALKKRAETLADMAAAGVEIKPVSPELTKLHQQLAALEGLGDNPAIATAIEQIRSQIRAKESSQLQDMAYRSERWKYLECFRDPAFYSSLSEEDKITFYRYLVDKVIVLNGEVQEIRLKV
ncbi:MAG: fdxN element excision recombinase XisF [Rhizonema sp. PD37]|nr:fdxN element excision recombinase XisF [Rhizonema sp. PD37]